MTILASYAQEESRSASENRKWRVRKNYAEGKDAGCMHVYGYAYVAEVNNLGSWGGLLTNLNYQVLDANRLPVKGLYATGSEAGTNLYNDTYVGAGIGLCNTVTSGYLCGKAMAEFVKGQL